MGWFQHVHLVVGTGGGGEEGQQAATGDDQVVGQLGDQVDGVDDEDCVVRSIDKVQNRLG